MENRHIELYKQEILELTKFLREEWLDLRELIEESGLNTEELLLICYCEDENDREFGVLFINENKILEFIVQNNELELKDITNIEGIENEIPQIKIASELL
ncbi:hypothetical protein [Flavobacterium johnsoniae]|uniref:Uncharacterized protein n=1 Tax=Flavobacterium johnsoniae TaxID=986 RepID=A0A1M5UAT4_FLAJO|nr:hypothetical protein [Flavobacterium johnsoniae]SHH60050.1 hypothetical protein SAMN05444388_11376 [Flavobacterium johnsoniae]